MHGCVGIDSSEVLISSFSLLGFTGVLTINSLNS